MITEKLSTTWMGMEQDTHLIGKHEAIFTVGVSASGKSTWANAFAVADYWESTCANLIPARKSWEILCRDNIRAEICCPFSWAAWKKLGGKAEKEVNKIQEERLNDIIERGTSLIIADTNLNFKNFKWMVDLLRGANYSIYFKFFPVDWKTAIERDNARVNGVGASVIAQQFEKLHDLERTDEHSVLNRAVAGKDAVLCDIDGTLAHMTSRGPYDYDKVSTDSVDIEILDILSGLYDQGYNIVIVSGRDGVCKSDTYRWLVHNLAEERGIMFKHYQRAVGDKRPDDVIKEELLEQIVDAGFNPKMVIDDRPRVARMWRRLGLKVLQVGNPYIEF